VSLFLILSDINMPGRSSLAAWHSCPKATKRRTLESGAEHQSPNRSTSGPFPNEIDTRVERAAGAKCGRSYCTAHASLPKPTGKADIPHEIRCARVAPLPRRYFKLLQSRSSVKALLTIASQRCEYPTTQRDAAPCRTPSQRPRPPLA
jgi:hypothetical protein